MAPLPQAPSPNTWPLRSTSQVYAEDLNTELSNAMTFLSTPPAFSGWSVNTTTSVANSGNTPILLDTILYDNYGTFLDTNNIKYQVPTGCGGVWLAIGGVPFSSGSTTANFQAILDLNSGATTFGGSSFPSAASATVTPMVADLLFIGDGTTIRLDGSQNTAGAVNTLANSQRKSFLNLVWVANTTGTAGLSPPSPRTWALNDECVSTGSLAGTGNFNTEIRNAVRFLSYVPFCRVGQSSPQSVAASADVHLTGLGPGVGNDNYSAYNTGTDTWTCPVSGTYLIIAQVGWTNASAASYEAEITAVVSSVSTTYRLSGALGQGNTTTVGMKTLRMTAGDTVQLVGRQNSGGALNTNAGQTRMSILWRST